MNQQAEGERVCRRCGATNWPKGERCGTHALHQPVPSRAEPAGETRVETDPARQCGETWEHGGPCRLTRGHDGLHAGPARESNLVAELQNCTADHDCHCQSAADTITALQAEVKRRLPLTPWCQRDYEKNWDQHKCHGSDGFLCGCFCHRFKLDKMLGDLRQQVRELEEQLEQAYAEAQTQIDRADIAADENVKLQERVRELEDRHTDECVALSEERMRVAELEEQVRGLEVQVMVEGQAALDFEGNANMMKARADRLAAALREYGTHRISCNLSNVSVRNTLPSDRCTCGLNAALAAEGSE